MVVERCTTDSWSASSASMQGWRKTHEDAHIFENSCGGPHASGVYFVLDGHGGSAAALHSSTILKGLMVPLAQRGTLSNADVEPELSRIFLEADRKLRAALPPEDRSGTTVVGALVTRTGSSYCVHTANAGDSRVVVFAGGKITASEDNKPCRPDERARIERAGGFVDHGPLGGGPLRVDGSLAVSRGFCDYQFKPADVSPELCKVSCVPEVLTVSAAPGDWILIACDGIFDVYSNEEVCDFISARLTAAEAQKGTADGGQICQDLLKGCLAKGSKDNCTAMLIRLHPDSTPKPYERELHPGDFSTNCTADIQQRYFDFFQAEGFQKEADQFRTQGSLGRQASGGSTATEEVAHFGSANSGGGGG